jgi:hypothetical protein
MDCIEILGIEYKINLHGRREQAIIRKTDGNNERSEEDLVSESAMKAETMSVFDVIQIDRSIGDSRLTRLALLTSVL